MTTSMKENSFNQINLGQSDVGITKKTKSSKSESERTIEQTYQKMSQLEHILLRPDTYVGSVERQSQQMWVYDLELKKIVFKNCSYVPGLFKIFDEIIVNAADNKQRDPTMNKIEVTIDPDENTIRVWNNGKGIPIAIHQEYNIYVPELIFGNLLTGSNFDDEQEKTTGGRNGYGAKLANIFSKEFKIETADSERGLKYAQVFNNNMGQKSSPEIKKYTGPDFTCITFKPDLQRFKMDFLDDDIVSLLSKRVYDIAGTSMAAGSRLNVHLNGSKIEIRNFEQYMGLFTGISPPCVLEKVNDRWEIGVGISDGSFQQVSYVNSICTSKGGQHVNYIVDQITSHLLGIVKRKNKGTEVKPAHIKNHLAIYVNALVVNPAFDSQTKENLTSKPSSFGSTCVLSEKLLKKIDTSGIVDNILSWAKFKQDAELKKKGGSKRSKLIGITKLDDANYAGTNKSSLCTLILTEGDSAKALAISGLSVIGRDYYGVFPLKGKLLNVREAAHQQIMKNEEIQNIAKILGLTFGKTYTDVSSLRYGHLMIMTDQDHDGSHIKGLLINFLHFFWPSLLENIPGFLQQFITPIVKCFRNNKEITFFTILEYLSWKENNNDGKGWKIKYYKGLGTSTSAEAKEYFSNLATHEINFAWDRESTNMIDMAFSKKRVDDRKQWLLSMDPTMFMNYNVNAISYNHFINHELIHFSHADNIRSIPHVMDGFKPSQRKVLFSCLKRNLKNEIKVAQLAGYISEHSAYHHGEVSLTQTIINMAQNFVGSNNINLLTPCGQFGTRLMLGKDAASPRYVFTKLETITRCIFHPDDDAILNYLDDDGQSIEPSFYVPIIPMVLVNGSEGIGTGWSTSVPTYNPHDIITYMRCLLRADNEVVDLVPWYRGFNGEIRAKTGKDLGNFVISGIIEQIDESTIVISELPVGKSTTDYKQFLESMVVGVADAPNGGIIKDFKENHTDSTVLFTITVAPEKMIEINNEPGGLAKKFKIDTSVATSNMHMFDMEEHIHKYERVDDIIVDFYGVRLEYYEKRKAFLLSKLSDEWEKLDNRVRFILAVIKGELVVSNRKKKDILQDLKKQGYKTFSVKKEKKEDDAESTEESPASNAIVEDDATQALSSGYDYLLSMKLWNLTLEKVQELVRERDSKYDDLQQLQKKSPKDLWLIDLDALEVALHQFESALILEKNNELKAMNKSSKIKSKSNNTSKKSKATKKKSKYSDEDDDDDSDNFDEDEDLYVKPKTKTSAVTSSKGNYGDFKPYVMTNTASAKRVPNPLIFKTIPVERQKAKSSSRQTETLKSKGDDRDDDEEESSVVSNEGRQSDEYMSLAQRLMSRMQIDKPKAVSVAVPSIASKAIKAPSKSTSKKTVTAPSKKMSNIVDLNDEDDENSNSSGSDEESSNMIVAPVIREKRSVAKALTYVVSDDEDERFSVSSDEEDAMSLDDDDGHESESDFEEDVKPKKTQKNVTSKKPEAIAKPAKAGIVKSNKTTVKASAITSSTSVSAVLGETKEKGKKRAPKSALSASSAVPSKSNVDLFSPGISSPRDVKKARVKQQDSLKTYDHMEVLATKKTAPKKSKKESAEKVTAKPSIAKSSVVSLMKSPKPVRQKKVATYSYDDEDDESDDSYGSLGENDDESDFE